MATAKGTPCDTRWRISQQSKRNRSKYNLNTSYFKINARYEVCVDGLHGLLIEQFELPESRKKISRKKKITTHYADRKIHVLSNDLAKLYGLILMKSLIFH